MVLLRLIYLIFGVTFGGVAILVFLFAVKPGLDSKHILEKGVETTATVTGIGSNVTANGEPLYYVRFSFVNSDGKEISGRTRSSYSANSLIQAGMAAYSDSTQALGVVHGSTIQVMRTGDKAAIKDQAAESENWLWIFVLVFGAVGAGMSIAFVSSVRTSLRNSRIKQYGRDGTGKYLEHSEGMKVNNVPLYRIHFVFEDYDGRNIEAKSGSSYRRHEAEALAAMKSFPIKYMGEKAIIMLDKNALLQNLRNN